MRSILPTEAFEILVTQNCNLRCKYCFEKCKSYKNADFNEIIDVLTGEGRFDTLPNWSFYVFGGEPLLNVEFITKLVDYIDKSDSISDEHKKNSIQSIVGLVTTNGILIDKYIDVIKKYNMYLQVSLDGPEDINDANRVDVNGKGYFKRIQDNLELLRKNGINYSLHGACSRDNYKNFCRICEFYIEEYVKLGRKDIDTVLYNNYSQIVFEDNITDDDINELLYQMYKVVQMIFNTPLLNNYPYEVRKRLAEGFLLRRGSICSSGNTMFSYDEELNVYPCHRPTTEGGLNRFMNLKDKSVIPDYKLYRQYQYTYDSKRLFTANIDDYSFNGNKVGINWCPSTNWEITGYTSHVPNKYGTLMAEINRFVPQLADYFGIDLENSQFRKSK